VPEALPFVSTCPTICIFDICIGHIATSSKFRELAYDLGKGKPRIRESVDDMGFLRKTLTRVAAGVLLGLAVAYLWWVTMGRRWVEKQVGKIVSDTISFFDPQ